VLIFPQPLLCRFLTLEVGIEYQAFLFCLARDFDLADWHLFDAGLYCRLPATMAGENLMLRRDKQGFDDPSPPDIINKCGIGFILINLNAKRVWVQRVNADACSVAEPCSFVFLAGLTGCGMIFDARRAGGGGGFWVSETDLVGGLHGGVLLVGPDFMFVDGLYSERQEALRIAMPE
jgi:hypothetical protein